MRTILKQSVHSELLKLQKRLGRELHSRHRLRIKETHHILELMSDLLTRGKSWERR